MAAERAAVAVRFKQGDIRELPAEEFDALVCWGNSFGYLPHAGTVAHLASCRRALREGGRLLLDSATVAELILPRLNERLDLDAGEVRMSGRQSYDVCRGGLVGEARVQRPDEVRETRQSCTTSTRRPSSCGSSRRRASR